jgi:hypothetical protein
VWYRFKTRCKNKKGKRTERGTRVEVSILETPPELDYYNLRSISRREQTEETKCQKRAGSLSRLVQISEFERYVAETENNEDLQHQHSVKTQYTTKNSAAMNFSARLAKPQQRRLRSVVRQPVLRLHRFGIYRCENFLLATSSSNSGDCRVLK